MWGKVLIKGHKCEIGNVYILTFAWYLDWVCKNDKIDNERAGCYYKTKGKKKCIDNITDCGSGGDGWML